MKGLSDMAYVMTLEDLDRVRRRYRVPRDIALWLLKPEQRVSKQPRCGIFLYEKSLRAGLRFPIQPLVKIMQFYSICPTMVAPNSWRNIVGFILMCNRARVTAMLSMFRVYYSLVFERSSEWPYTGPRKSFKMILDNPSSIKE